MGRTDATDVQMTVGWSDGSEEVITDDRRSRGHVTRDQERRGLYLLAVTSEMPQLICAHRCEYAWVVDWSVDASIERRFGLGLGGGAAGQFPAPRTD